MKVAIVPIGNSRGIRLPKAVLDQLGFGAEAELAVEDGRVTLMPLSVPRRGWAEAFAENPPESFTQDEHDWLEAELLGDEDA